MEIHENLYWEHLSVAGALAVSVFVVLGLLLRLREIPKPRMYIWAMIAFFTVNICDGLNSFAYSDTFNGPPALSRWNDVIIPGFMVALYFYVRALTSAAPKLHRADLVHLLPFLGGFFLPCPNPHPARRREAGPDRGRDFRHTQGPHQHRRNCVLECLGCHIGDLRHDLHSPARPSQTQHPRCVL